MRIAIVHPYPVWSRAVGGTTRVYALVRHLAARHEVHVFTHGHGETEEEAEAVRELAGFGVTQRVFPRPPAPWLTKARWAAMRTPYFVSHNRNPALEAALAALDRERGVDVGHLELIALAPLLAGLGTQAARVLAEQELMSITIERLRGVSWRHKNAYQIFITRQIPGIRRFESETLRRFDRLFGINDFEAARMAELSGRKVEVLPHVVDTRVFTPGDSPPLPGSVLFVGNYGHHPNVEAVFWLMERVWPAVRAENAGARARLVGPGLDAKQVRALEALGAEVAGRVDDLAGAYRAASVFANPILSGGGMRGKVLEAMACGVPVVSTGIGLEGVAATPGEHCDRADDARAFAGALLRLLADRSLRAARAGRARSLVVGHYDARIVMERLETAFEEARAARRSGAQP